MSDYYYLRIGSQWHGSHSLHLFKTEFNSSSPNVLWMRWSRLVSLVDPRFRNSGETVIVGRGNVFGSQSGVAGGVSCRSNTATLRVDWLGHSTLTLQSCSDPGHENTRWTRDVEHYPVVTTIYWTPCRTQQIPYFCQESILTGKIVWCFLLVKSKRNLLRTWNSIRPSGFKV